VYLCVGIVEGGRPNDLFIERKDRDLDPKRRLTFLFN
jgi:hypothetical protein